MKDEIKKLKTLLVCGIVQIVLNFVLTLLVILTFIATITSINNTDPNQTAFVSQFAVYTVLLIILGIAASALNITTSAIILASNWKSKWCNENKLLWGLLTLLVLSAIGTIIFSAIGMQKAKQPNNYAYENQNYTAHESPSSNQIPEYYE